MKVVSRLSVVMEKCPDIVRARPLQLDFNLQSAFKRNLYLEIYFLYKRQ